MPRLRDRLRSSASRWRDRLGIVCAVGAVACLASLIVHWSRQYPVQRSLWEQDLFGDLAELDPPEAESPSDTRPPEPLDIESAQSAAPTLLGDSVRDEPILVDVTPGNVDHNLATPIEHRLVEHQPRFIQSTIDGQVSNPDFRAVSFSDDRPGDSNDLVTKLLHEQADGGPSVWLSGGIEVEMNGATDDIEEPVKLFFPNESRPR